MNKASGGDLKVEGDWRVSAANTKKKVKGFSVEGCVYDIIGALNNMANIMCYLDHTNTEDRDVIIAIDKDRLPQKNVRTKDLSLKTGMIGLPQLKESVMLDCACLLDPQMNVADIVSITSEMVPAVDGKYLIIDLTHSGHFRGNDWTTKIRAIDPERVSKDAGLKGNGGR